MITDIPKPTFKEIEKYKNKWELLEKYPDQEKSLEKLFRDLIPNNRLLEDVLIKTCILNDFYSTNIKDVFKVANHIHDLDIDERLNVGDLTLIDDIASKKAFGRRNYSFATKYCSHHKPHVFPIYDSYVAGVLIHFRDVDNFADFYNKDLKDYEKFVEVLKKFIEYYSLENYNFKEIDKYLWLSGREYGLKKIIQG